MKKKYLIAAIAALTTGLPAATLPLPALAATLEEVVVTARKRAESLQTTPVSITTLSGEALAQAGINQLTAIERQTPNLNFTVGTGGGSSTVNAFLRGVGEFDFILTTDPAVGLYLDGIYLSRAFGANLELSDVERIEVLRGPQGTLFGKNSIGGAISVITRKPTGDTDAEVKLSAGSRDLRGISVYGQTAISDTLAVSGSYLQRKADGWQKRPGDDAGDVDLATARVILNWTPGDSFESTLSVDWHEQDQTGYPNVMLTWQDGTTFGDLWNLVNPGNPCCTPNVDIDRSGAGGPLPNDDVEGLGVNWTNTWQVSEALELKSITGYREVEALFGRDGDNSLVNYNGDVHDQDHEQFSQEFQLVGTHGPLEWVGGLYYFEEDTQDDTDLIIIQGLGTSVSFDNRQKTTSYAAYAHASYAVSEQLDLFAGIRYTREEKDFTQQISNFDFGVPHVFFIPGLPVDSCAFDEPTAYFDCSQDWSNTSPKAGLSWQFNDDVMAFAHVSRGFRSGGYNGRAFGSAADLQEYEPEILTGYEIGLKADLLQRTLRLNGAMFYNDYEDIQVLITRAGSVAVENASKASIEGVELEATWLPTDSWQIQAGLGYLSDDSDGWVDVTGDYTDTELKHTPEMTFNLGLDYLWNLGDRGNLLLRGDMRYSDSYYLNAVNSPTLEVPGHSLFGVGLIYSAPRENWELALIGTNLGDKRVLNSGFDGSGFFGYFEGSYNRPRTVELSLTMRL
ncbi:TonB-dependent receptor [Haliea sp. E1-2-M8]|uniref:TonB-dependent receptor n=1 Tax=Haliea sp. E1-2-M8 TaxID=3064706 RepID=UPI00271796CE|nr:TonB-dependent receptor [Haliea sp. E1-2-M8]MDO8863481.1 TonB-dependent receptor [Haliea sp. E1-2-M8]